MATETTKLVYGSNMMLFLAGTAMAFSTSAKLEVKVGTRDISSKDSGVWKEKLAGKIEWSASTDALYTEDLIASAPIASAVNVSITSGAAILTSVSALFTPEDVGRPVIITGAGVAAVNLVTTILSYTSATSVTLATNAGTTKAALPVFQWDATATSYNELYTLMTNRTTIGCVFGETKGVAPAFVLDTTATKKNLAGTAIITGLSVNAPDGETVTYSISLEGTAALVMA